MTNRKSMSAKTIVEAIPEIKATVYQSGGKSDNKSTHKYFCFSFIHSFYFHLSPICTLVKSIKIKNNKNNLKPIKTSIKIIKVKNEAMMKSHVSEFKTNKIFSHS